MALAKMILDTPSGAQLALYAQEAVGAARAIIHINHGLAEHALRYQPLADMLCELGYHVIAQDHRGHGATRIAGSAQIMGSSQPGSRQMAPSSPLPGNAASPNDISQARPTARTRYLTGAPPRIFASNHGWDRVIEDVGAVNARIRKLNPGLPIVLVGHSMGGLIALEYLLRQPGSVEAASIWGAPVYKDKGLYLARALLALEGMLRRRSKPSLIFNLLAFGSYNKKITDSRTPFDWLSRDTDEVDAYIADPRCGWTASNSMARDIIRGSLATFDDTRLKSLPGELPLLLMGGKMDPVTRYGAALSQLHQRLAVAGLSRVTLAQFEGMRHEIHNEEGNNLPLQRFVDWLTTALAARA